MRYKTEMHWYIFLDFACNSYILILILIPKWVNHFNKWKTPQLMRILLFKMFLDTRIADLSKQSSKSKHDYLKNSSGCGGKQLDSEEV